MVKIKNAFFRKKANKRFARSFGGNLCMNLIVILTAAVLALPLVYAFMQALKPMEEIYLFPPRFFVSNPTFDNFIDLSVLCANLWMPFTKYLFNSVIVTVVATVGNVIVCSACAYPLAMHDFPGKKTIFQIVVVALMFVSQVTFLPRYLVMAKIGMIDTWFAMILPHIATSLGVFLMKQFIEQLPFAIVEAARMDGCSEFRIFWKLIMPNVKPAWLTLAIFSFQSVWNDTSVENLVFSDNMRTLPTIIKEITSGTGIERAGVSAAATIFLMIPPLVLFISVQSRVVETMAFAGLKD